MLLAPNPRCKAGMVIRFENRNRCLGQDRTGIELLGDQMNRATADGDTGGQGLPDGVQTSEAGEQ
jgi:hypothetical protein